MDGKLYIKKFIRDDGESLSFDTEEIYLAESNTLLVRANPATSAIEYTESDGGEMIRQRNATYVQPIKGLIISKTSTYWALVTKLSLFFKINHTYKIIYIRKDQTMFAISGAWISTGLQIVPVPHEEYSEWSIDLTIGNNGWREYTEDAQGRETYANTVTLPLISAAPGGETWDNVGLVAGNVGEEWETGHGGVQTVNIESTQTIYPVWVVNGPCVNPKLQNNTTDTIAEFNGTVAAGQTLSVDFEAGTAFLNSALVTRYLSGIVSFTPGENLAGFNSDGGSTQNSTISWNNIIN